MTRAPWRRGARLVPIGLALVLLPVGPAVGSPQEAPAPVRSTAHTVTLLTGDKVTVADLGGGRKAVTVERARGATGAVRSQTVDGRVRVVPDEARPYLADGTLDPRLFDVSGLIEQGLGGGSLPLLVTYGKGRSVRDALPPGVQPVRTLPSIRGAAVRASGDAFWRALTAVPQARGGFSGGVAKVWLDGRVKAAMAESNAQIGTPQAWAAGLTGKGVKVAVLDTGVDADHPDLTGRVGAAKSFVEGEEVADRNGHGTHVTSTVGGSGAASDGKEKGVAPGADLAVGKVLSDAGTGSESQIIAGMEWAAEDVHAKVVSMSLGSQEASDGTDPMAQAVNTLSHDTGALFVIAAGNTGAPSSIGSPGAADAALTVGAVDSADQAAYFSSQGPRLGDNALKPDLSAPGVDILAARSRYTAGSGPYTAMSGTSMATPHVAGVAALLAEEHPDWSGQRLKDALMSTSKVLDAEPYALGAGRVDVPAATTAPVTATGSADLGFVRWPYGDDQPVTRTLTYTNSSDTAVRLALSVDGGAPAGVVSLADAELTVPAHGTARTTVTGDGTHAAVGHTSGRVTASVDGKPVAHTVFGLVKEEERYDLTVHVRDRDGAPSPANLSVQQLAQGQDPFGATVGDSGTLTLRLRPGTYTVDSFLDVRGSKGADSLGLGYLSDPEVVLDRDREITLDGRRLRELRAEVDRRTETRQLLMEYDRSANGATVSGAVQVPVAYDSVFAAPTRKVRTGTFEYRTVWRLGKPLLDVEAGGRRLGDALVQAGSTPFDGRRRVGVADAGAGSEAEYAGKDVRGKAVVVRAAAGVTPQQQASAARRAGVAALFVTDDAPGRLSAWFGTDEGADAPLTVASVNAADAARLREVARRGGTAVLVGTRYTPYVYDLSEGHPGAVPDADLTYRPRGRELAAVDTAFHAPGGPATGGEFRYSITGTFPIGFGFAERIAYPARRTDYVSTGPGQRWHESVTLGDSALEERGGLVTYRGGARTALDWFGPVWHPWLGTGLGWGQQRTGNDLRFNTPGWGDGGSDHTGFGDVWSRPSMTQVTSVYVDGVQVDRRVGSGAYAWGVDPAPHTFRVTTDTTLDPSVWRLSTRGHAEWTFRSAETPTDRATTLPLLNLAFDVPTDLSGNVSGRRVPVGLRASYVAGASVGTGRIGAGVLEVSYDDGVTWGGVGLSRVGEGAWRGELRVPAGVRFVSLRGVAGDDRGGVVREEVVRAVGVG
ncbi:S8 family serine peptidase [Streptomyces melanogenes]|uniref:S8 family serine peptidase n=1 Tax=Streptomyces melanogenes TaxID=67326 RepID=A0ABZ1XHX0_9ACTN|nr:S8 family serine peptidase [Streptomyces melanogenes]